MNTNHVFWDKLAIQTYKSLLKKNSDSPLIYYHLGLAYKRMGKIKKAIISLKKALKLNKTLDDAYYHLGNCYLSLGNLDQAKKMFSKKSKLTSGKKDENSFVESLLESIA